MPEPTPSTTDSQATRQHYTLRAGEGIRVAGREVWVQQLEGRTVVLNYDGEPLRLLSGCRLKLWRATLTVVSATDEGRRRCLVKIEAGPEVKHEKLNAI